MSRSIRQASPLPRKDRGETEYPKTKDEKKHKRMKNKETIGCMEKERNAKKKEMRKRLL